MFLKSIFALLASSIFAAPTNAQDNPATNFEGLCFDGGEYDRLVEIKDNSFDLQGAGLSCLVGNPIAVKGMNGTLFDVQCITEDGTISAERMFFLRYESEEVNGEIGLIASNKGMYPLRSCGGALAADVPNGEPIKSTGSAEMSDDLKAELQDTFKRVAEDLPPNSPNSASSQTSFIWSRHGDWNVVRDETEPMNCFAETFVDTALGRTGVYLGWAAGGNNGILAISNARWGSYQSGVHGLEIFFDGNLALNGNSTFEIEGFPAPQFSLYLTANDFEQIKKVIAAHASMKLSFFKSNSPKSVMVETDVLSLRGSAAAISDMVRCQSEFGRFAGEPVSADSFLLNPNPK